MIQGHLLGKGQTRLLLIWPFGLLSAGGIAYNCILPGNLQATPDIIGPAAVAFVVVLFAMPVSCYF